MKKQWSKRFLQAAAVLGLSLWSGCTSPPAEEAVFIPPEYAQLMKQTEESGFQKAWGKPAEIRKYDKITVAVVVSPKQLESSLWGSANIYYLVKSEEEELQELAEYTNESFRKAFTQSKHFKLKEQPGAGILALEFAIVQAVPNKPILGAVSNLSSLTPIGLIVLPLKLGAKSISDDNGGAIAMESVIRDSQSGSVLAVFADREKGATALFNAKEFTPLANIHAIIDLWTANLVSALDQVKEGKRVKVESQAGFSIIDY